MAQNNQDKIKELLTRGVEEVIVRESLEKKLKSGQKLRVKHGIDPTAPVIHLGNAIPLWKLRQFQDLGHQIVLIIGDFTARIGDTSDKTAIRQPLSKKQIEANMKDYQKQIGQILDLTKTEFVYNSVWLSKLSFEKLLRLASQFTVAQMIERENFTERYKAGKPIALEEFLYPLLQGYDSVKVRADLEVGGTDQVFNMLAGRVIQKAYHQPPQDIITLTLIEGTDGQKMSKSYDNMITIIDQPNDMYGQIMSMTDDLIIKYFTLCSQVPLDEVKKIKKDLAEKKINPRDAKARLAHEIVSLYHGPKAAKKAEQEFNRIFKEHKEPTKMKNLKFKIKNWNILDLLVQTKLAPSKAEAKRLVEQGGVKIDNQTIKDWQAEIEIKDGMIVQVGKRKFLRLVFL